MQLKKNKELARKAINIWTTGEIELVDEFYAKNCINYQHHHPHSRQSLKGSESWKKYILEFRDAFPDYSDTIEDQIAEGDKVVSRIISRGTHKGPLMGIKPTNKRVHWTGIIIDRIEKNKIVETWVNWDMHGLLEQLDVVTLHNLSHYS